MKKLTHLPFRAKLVVTFVAIFLIIYTSSTVLLVNAASNRSLNDAKALLSLLTDQVLINLEQVIITTQRQVFNLYNSLDIPEKMHELDIEEQNVRQATQNLQYSVNQMVSAVYPYDFVLVRTLDGHDTHTGGKIENGDEVYQQARELLDGYEGDTLEWARTEDNNVYLMRDAYSLSPLAKVGQIIVRMSDEKLFTLGEETEQLECSLMLFDRENNHILTTGFINDEKQNLISETMRNQGLSDGFMTWLGSEYYIVVRKSGSWSMVGLLPIDRLNDVRKDVMLNSFFIAAIGLFIGIWVVIMLTKRLTRQLNVLTDSIDAVAIGDMKQIVPIYSQDDIGQIAIRFNNMTRRISELLQRVVNEEKHKNEAEFQMLEYRYRSLHTQINSHFIYNALETVNAFAKLKGNKEISNVVQLMSRYFRNNTKNITRQFITLQQEYEYLQDYAEIHRYIHGDRLVVRFEYSDAASDALLPTMILQPVLENALEHGVSAAKEQTLIRLAAEVKNDDRLVITIVDDGLGMSDEVISRIFQPDYPRKDARSGIGLRNVAERLQIIYADQADISVESGNQGTCVTITLPLNYIAQMPIKID